MQAENSPSPNVIGHIDPSLAQFTRASTLLTTNSAAGLAECEVDVEMGRASTDAAEMDTMAP